MGINVQCSGWGLGQLLWWHFLVSLMVKLTWSWCLNGLLHAAHCLAVFLLTIFCFLSVCCVCLWLLVLQTELFGSCFVPQAEGQINISMLTFLQQVKNVKINLRTKDFVLKCILEFIFNL